MLTVSGCLGFIDSPPPPPAVVQKKMSENDALNNLGRLNTSEIEWILRAKLISDMN